MSRIEWVIKRIKLIMMSVWTTHFSHNKRIGYRMSRYSQIWMHSSDIHAPFFLIVWMIFLNVFSSRWYYFPYVLPLYVLHMQPRQTQTPNTTPRGLETQLFNVKYAGAGVVWSIWWLGRVLSGCRFHVVLQRGPSCLVIARAWNKRLILIKLHY